jgi:hypothetical protein
MLSKLCNSVKRFQTSLRYLTLTILDKHSLRSPKVTNNWQEGLLKLKNLIYLDITVKHEELEVLLKPMIGSFV